MVLGLVGAIALSLASPPAASTTEAFTDANHAFFGLYAAAKAAKVHNTGPVIITNGGAEATLVWHGERFSSNYTPELVNTLKVIAHMPLALMVAVEDHTQRDNIVLDANTRAALQSFKPLLTNVRDALPHAGFHGAQLARQQGIVDASLSTLTALLQTAPMPRSKFDAYLHQITPAVQENIEEAVHLQLDALNKQVIAWRDKLGDAWSDLHVITVVPHMPRQGHLQAQYFMRLLHQEEEGHRVIVMEGRGQDDAALDLLGTHALDRQVSLAFFDDPHRMHRDLMGDAATAYIDRMPLPGFPHPQVQERR